MALLLSNVMRDQAVSAIINGMTALYLFSGTAPASAEDSSSGVLLGYFNVEYQWSESTAGTASLASTVVGVMYNTSGTVGYARLTNPAFDNVIQTGVGTSATADVQLQYVVLSGSSGSTMGLYACTIIQPAS